MPAYGDGGIFRRGSVWYAWLYHRGRMIRESLHTTDEETARRRLSGLRRRRDRGTYQDPAARRVTVDELLDDLVTHLEVKGAAAVAKSRSTLKAVRAELGGTHAGELDTAMVEKAQRTWLRQKKAAATVNRRCELLRQAYRLAVRRTPPKVGVIPHIPVLTVQNARQGFLSASEIARLLAGFVDPDLRDYVEWCAWTGMRPGEVRQITWAMVDPTARTLQLDPRAAKTRRGRTLALEGPLWTILERRRKARRLGCELVFHRTSKGRPGQPVRDYRKAFALAVKAAKLPRTLLPYDLRRSAIRNMVRAGVDVSVVMKISGHRTRSTFDRYNIVNEADVRKAVEATAAWAAKTLPKTLPSGGGK
jgi:integrase